MSDDQREFVLARGRLISSQIAVSGTAPRISHAQTTEADELSMPNRQAFYGWKLVAVLWFLDFLNMGFPLYGGAVINTYMLKDIAMSRSTFGLGFTLLNLFVGLPSILVAAAILRWGIRRTFWDWVCCDSLRGAMGRVVCLKTLALCGGLRSSNRHGDQFRNDCSRFHGGHKVVQAISRKSDGDRSERVGLCWICRRASH
jgi:hypothetical protein